MSYFNDIALGDTIDIKFTTRAFATGAPTTLAGVPVISAYPGNSVTQLTAGITLTVDFDAVTGLHNIRVVATGANGYATATNYALVITTGTVGGVSVVGETVASFSIENRSALRPTVAARTLDVTATGEAGLDWANIGGPTTAQNFSATTIGIIGTGGIVAGSFAANAIDAAAIAANAIGSSEFAQAAADKVFGSGGATLAELAQAAPAATPRPDQAMMLLYMTLRNKLDITASTKNISNDAGTVIAKKALTDDAVTYSEAKMVTGP